ncbi:MAG TPA: DoxX family protein [Candidatus Limnocylindria bacterium]|nr:DoxX family protein [Candidatus Limnocylindria bacterium]
MTDLARLIVRLVVGGLLAGHGAQKLFGWFEGPGQRGTEGMMESMNLHPPRFWATLAGASEFGGGLLTALGALNPFGPLGIIGAMSMATAKVHWGKPIWAGKGGAELPLTNLASAAALALVGPGKYSIDHALGIRLPRWIGIFGLLGLGMVLARALQPELEVEPAQLETSETDAQEPMPEPATV